MVSKEPVLGSGGVIVPEREKYNKLLEIIQGLDSVLVAFSGGVDSTLLLAACIKSLGRDKVLAVTAASPIHKPEELALAKDIARQLGVRWLQINTVEMDNPLFVANEPDRCYHCKAGMLAGLFEMASHRGFINVVEGSNLSDINDFRPGFKAVRESGVKSPLLEAGLTKGEIMVLAREAGLSNWNRPPDACLCSRIPFGTAIRQELLEKVYKAEKLVQGLGISPVRVRVHGDTARVEVPPEDMGLLCDEKYRQMLVTGLKNLGFKYVSIDLEGYRTGSMNPGQVKR